MADNNLCAHCGQPIRSPSIVGQCYHTSRESCIRALGDAVTRLAAAKDQGDATPDTITLTREQAAEIRGSARILIEDKGGSISCQCPTCTRLRLALEPLEKGINL